jgi:tyrosinase
MTAMAITFEIELPGGDDRPEPARADLTFYGLDHSGPSYQVRVFFSNPSAGPGTPLTAGEGYVGKFSVFAHGGCFGEEGHCEVRPPVSPFDRRQPHPLAPIARYLTVTDAIRDLIGRGERSVTVTAVPVVRASALATADQAADVLTVDQVALHTFE